LRHVSTINRHRMPCDKRCGLGTEPHHGFSNFLRISHAANGFTGNHQGYTFGILHPGFRHRRPDIARAHAIDTDTLFYVLQGRRPCADKEKGAVSSAYAVVQLRLQPRWADLEGNHDGILRQMFKQFRTFHCSLTVLLISKHLYGGLLHRCDIGMCVIQCSVPVVP
jgi:hypothetical protein